MYLWKATFLTCLLAAITVAAAGCQHMPRAEVKDYDTFQLINLGEVWYTAPEGLPVIERGRGYVVHSVDAIPGAHLRIEADPSPPRSLRVDAGTHKRRFVSEVAVLASSSVQYSDRKDREIVKVIARSRLDDPNARFGSMMLIRKDRTTAIVKVWGPLAKRTEMNNLIERMSRHIQFGELDLL